MRHFPARAVRVVSLVVRLSPRLGTWRRAHGCGCWDLTSAHPARAMLSLTSVVRAYPTLALAGRG